MFVQGFPSRKKSFECHPGGKPRDEPSNPHPYAGLGPTWEPGILTGPPDLTIQQAMGWMDMKRLRKMVKGTMTSLKNFTVTCFPTMMRYIRGI